MDDLVPNSMNILEPSPVDDKGNQREDRKFLFSLFFFWNLPFMYVNCWAILIEVNCSIDFFFVTVMSATNPVDLFLLPGNRNSNIN